MSFEFVLNALGLAQSSFTHDNDLRWSEISYFLQQRQVRVDILNNAREDLQDLFQKDQRMLDTQLVVVTLMMGIGFGFVVEGTFPEGDRPRGDVPKSDTYQQIVRQAYAILAAFALVFPFWSLLCLLECRRRTIHFMRAFNQHFHEVMKAENTRFLNSTEADEMARNVEVQDLPRRFPRVLCGFRLGPLFRICARRATSHASPREPISEADNMIKLSQALHQEYLDWWTCWCKSLHTKAIILLLLGIVSNVLTAPALLAAYFSSRYAHTPWVSRSYVIVVLLGLMTAVLCIIGWTCMGPEIEIERHNNCLGALRYPAGSRLPDWMLNRPLLSEERADHDVSGFALNVRHLMRTSVSSTSS